MFSRKDLVKLMVPLIIEQLLAVAVGMVDVIMVASVGEAAVSGVSLVDSITFLIIQLLAALATGGAVVASQYLGSGEKDKACVAANQLVFVTVASALVITAFAMVGNEFLLRTIFGNIDHAVMEDAKIYFLITALSYPFLALYNSCAAIFRSMGNSKVSMMISLLMNSINVIGNVFCIYGLKMGVEGVAIPTLVSRVVAAAAIMLLIRKPQNEIHIDSRFRLGYHPDMIKKILKIGVPSGLENSMFQMGKIMVQSLVAGLGTATMAGFAVTGNIITLEYLPGNAIALGLITVVGQCVGAQKYDEVKKYTKKLVLVNYAIVTVIVALVMVFYQPISSIYNLSGEAARITEKLVIWHGFFMIIWPVAFVIPNALRAASDVKFTMVVSVFSMWAFRIELSYLLILKFGFGVEGIWIAMFIDWCFRAALFTVRFCSGKWRCHTEKISG